MTVTPLHRGPMRPLLAMAVASVLAACAEQPARTAAVQSPGTTPTPWALATSTVQWNDYACDLIARNAVGQFPALRTLAYTNLAINNAIVEARKKGIEPDGAAAGAAATVLVFFFPKDEQAINTRLAGEVAAIGTSGRQRFASGVDIGKTAANEVIALAKADRSDIAWTGSVPTGDDKWSSRMQPPRPPLGANLPQMRTFFMKTPADFRVPPPPPPDSAQWQATVREVRTMAEARTPQQLRIAQYWENLSGSFAAGQWNIVARNAIAKHGVDEATSARALAMVHMAGLDANIACHDSKYVYWVPRPTQADKDIKLAIGVPNHPSYPSNHACISGTVGLLMDSLFPADRGLYWRMAQQAGESRIYGGIHYRVDLDAGYEIARKLAARAQEVGIPTDRPFVPVGR